MEAHAKAITAGIVRASKRTALAAAILIVPVATGAAQAPPPPIEQISIEDSRLRLFVNGPDGLALTAVVVMNGDHVCSIHGSLDRSVHRASWIEGNVLAFAACNLSAADFDRLIAGQDLVAHAEGTLRLPHGRKLAFHDDAVFGAEHLDFLHDGSLDITTDGEVSLVFAPG